MGKLYRYTLLLLVLITTLSACMPIREGTIKRMSAVGHKEVGLFPHKGTAIVVFVRPKDTVSKFQCDLFDVESLSADPKLIGILAANTSTVYETQPGRHIFMSTGGMAQADFITADLLPDTTYYILVDGQVSNWGPYRLFLKPPEMAGLSIADMKTRFDQSRVVLKSPDSEQWARDSMPSIRSRLATFNKKSANGEVPHVKAQMTETKQQPGQPEGVTPNFESHTDRELADWLVGRWEGTVSEGPSKEKKRILEINGVLSSEKGRTLLNAAFAVEKDTMKQVTVVVENDQMSFVTPDNARIVLKKVSDASMKGSISATGKPTVGFTFWKVGSLPIASSDPGSKHQPAADKERIGPVQWRMSEGGNGHYYDIILVPSGINWTDAKNDAVQRGGYLATILSAEENQFIFKNLVDDKKYWYLPPDFPWSNQNWGPWIGAYRSPGTQKPTEGWQWVNGDGSLDSTYSNWLPGEPNGTNNNENAALFYDNDPKNGPIITSKWNDVRQTAQTKSYVIEYNSKPAPEAVATHEATK